MPKGPRVDNAELLEAGLELMRRNGKPLAKLASRGRAMLYRLPDGQTVRARTCNDHILIAVADSPTEGAKLNIEGTDWLLIVMPVVERMPGSVIGYLVPTAEAVDAVRRTHSEWLASNPNTRGKNTTWNLWFSPDGPEKARGFADKWAKYRLEGSISISKFAARSGADEERDVVVPGAGTQEGVRPLNMADAKRAVAAFYRVDLDAIEITIRG